VDDSRSDSIKRAFEDRSLILPDSRLKSPKSRKMHMGISWVPVFCANCGAPGGYVPEENCNFAFYLCDDRCAPMWAELAGTMVEPDAVFWEKVRQAQIEKFGRVLDVPQIVEALKDPQHPLTKLCKDRPTRGG
jgi:hypothetical protein